MVGLPVLAYLRPASHVLITVRSRAGRAAFSSSIGYATNCTMLVLPSALRPRTGHLG